MNLPHLIALACSLSLGLAASAAGADSTLGASMTGSGQPWEYGDQVWFIHDALDAPGATSYVTRVAQALRDARPDLDLVVDHRMFGYPRGLGDVVSATVAMNEPVIAVLCLGHVNALAKTEDAISVAEYGANLSAAIAELKAVHCEVVVLGPTVVSDAPEGKTPADERIAQCADAASSAAKQAGVTFIDLRAACIEQLKTEGHPSLTPGGAQFTNAWHELAADRAAKAIGEVMAALPMRVDIADAPFVDEMLVALPVRRAHSGAELDIRYSLDGRDATKGSRKYERPFTLTSTTTVNVLVTDKANNRTATAKAVFTKVKGRVGESVPHRALGLEWGLFRGDWQTLPDFAALEPVALGVSPAPQDNAFYPLAGEGQKREHVGLRFLGYLDVPIEGAYRFSTISDDGSRMWIDDELVVDNDGGHGHRARHGLVALHTGPHPVRVDWFNGGGFGHLEVLWKSAAGIRLSVIPDSAWCRNPTKPHDWKPPEKVADKKN